MKNYDFESLVAKLKNRTKYDAYKLIYQWVVDRHIDLSEFVLLCDVMAGVKS